MYYNYVTIIYNYTTQIVSYTTTFKEYNFINKIRTNMKIILIASSTILLFFTSCTEKDADNNGRDHDMKNNDMNHQGMEQSHGDGFMMMNGKMMMQQNGKMSTMHHDTTMSNGMQVMINGNCINKEGTKFTMKEGQHMDMTGYMTPMTDSITIK